MRALRLFAGIAAVYAFSLYPLSAHEDHAVIMSDAASNFLAALTPEQRAKTVYAFDDEKRLDWHFIPPSSYPRKGIPLKELTPSQKHLAMAFLSSGLSQQGYIKTTTIMSLEEILHALSQGRGPVRDAELYYMAVFGEPGPESTWGWNIEGHHVSLHYTVVGGEVAATVPTFLGSNPAEVQEGPRKGLRVLAREEDIAFELLGSLGDAQLMSAVIDDEAPNDIATGNKPRVEPLDPKGLAVGQMNEMQTQLVIALLEEYANNMPTRLAEERMQKVRDAGLDKVVFAWMGRPSREQGHYYRLQGPTFVVEYDNVQNNANHVHSVWRDFAGDFGADLLAEHYRTAPHHQTDQAR